MGAEQAGQVDMAVMQQFSRQPATLPSTISLLATHATMHARHQRQLTASSSMGSCSACSTGGMRCLASLSRCFKSSRMCSLWFLLMKVVAMPVLPLRPARDRQALQLQAQHDTGGQVAASTLPACPPLIARRATPGSAPHQQIPAVPVRPMRCT